MMKCKIREITRHYFLNSFIQQYKNDSLLMIPVYKTLHNVTTFILTK